MERVLAAFQTHDASAVIDQFSAEIIYEDRRPFAGGLITSIDYLRGQRSRHAGAIRPLRGTHSWPSVAIDCASHGAAGGTTAGMRRPIFVWPNWTRMVWSRLCCTSTGTTSASAYRELDARYYAGEGAAYAHHGRTQSAFVEAMDHLDAAAARQLCRPEFRWLSPTRGVGRPGAHNR